MKLIKTPVYLRDLSEECQKNWLQLCTLQMIEQEKKGAEITVGYYLKKPKVKT